MTPIALAERVKATGRRLGFDLCAIGPAEPPEHGAAFEAWLDAGYGGTMAYLERSRARRLDPQRVLPGARTAVACALNYHQGPAAGGPRHVARYAWGADYHDLMERRLRELLADLASAAPGTAGRVYVDTGPLLERELAARAGLGWVGKNTMLLHPALGSYFLVGVVLATAELAVDAPLADRCGRCTRCLEACPTGAFPEPYVLDARRCISYLTIEHRGTIPVELRPAVGGLAFGCDICQDACPWNRRAPVTGEPAFAARPLPGLAGLVGLSEEGYRVLLRGSPLRRARRRGLRRNAAVALGNAGDEGAIGPLTAALADPEAEVRRHAAWALGRYHEPSARASLRAASGRETDPDVRREIDEALGMTERRNPDGDRCGS